MPKAYDLENSSPSYSHETTQLNGRRNNEEESLRFKKPYPIHAALTLAVTSIATSLLADHADTVQAYYDLLTNPRSETHTAAFVAATTNNWKSVGGYSGESKSHDAFWG